MDNGPKNFEDRVKWAKARLDAKATARKEAHSKMSSVEQQYNVAPKAGKKPAAKPATDGIGIAGMRGLKHGTKANKNIGMMPGVAAARDKRAAAKGTENVRRKQRKNSNEGSLKEIMGQNAKIIELLEHGAKF